MIRIEGLWKTYHMNGRSKVVARNMNATMPSRTAVALLGRNGAGKSTLMQMIAGTMTPDDGQVVSSGSISWPVDTTCPSSGVMVPAIICIKVD